jgi:hypothetical protein
MDEEWSCQVSTSTDSIEWACDVILVNRRVAINEVEAHLHTWKWCTYGSLLSQKPLLTYVTQKLNQCWTVCVDKIDDYMEGGEHSSRFSNPHVLIVLTELRRNSKFWYTCNPCTYKLSYNIMKGTEHFVSLSTSVVLTKEYNVVVNSKGLIGTLEHLTLQVRCCIHCH